MKKGKKESKQAKSVRAASGKMNVQPLADRVLVKPLSAEEAGKKLPSGIIIPETVDKEKPEQ